ncbi:hypothetical protein BHYA_0157g00010 [Botrytis hyacinthi]|uniref:Uncharacterized protein n=1 Tax=Botrytis hyacinthi TaxID=278943 RepID=A0A4Z1GPB1_9HELO|nr:hypothetical protein BHYA_0157g00010 [Botrytis hyacinthi]
MQGNNICLLFLLPQKLRYTARDKRIGNPVESIFSQTVLLCDFLINGVGGDVLWDCRVELRVEDRDVAGGGEVRDAVLDDGECGGVVQRSQIGERFEVVQRFPGDELAGLVVPAVHDAVAGEGDVGELGDVLEGGVVDEVGEDVLECGVLVGDFVVEFLVLGDGFSGARVFEGWGWGGEAGDLGFGEGFGGGVAWRGGEDGDFDGGGSGVYGEDDFGHGGREVFVVWGLLCVMVRRFEGSRVRRPPVDD